MRRVPEINNSPTPSTKVKGEWLDLYLYSPVRLHGLENDIFTFFNSEFVQDLQIYPSHTGFCFQRVIMNL